MASPVGVIWAVTVSVAPGAIDAIVAGSNVTSQLVGVLADGLTSVIGAVPELVMVSWKVRALPALAVVDSTWSGVDTDIV